jgi:hypothetical protein
MIDDEKAAIAAGLWEPGRPCVDWTTCRIDIRKGRIMIVNHEVHKSIGPHDIPAPDMHDPVNLLRGAKQAAARAGKALLGYGDVDCLVRIGARAVEVDLTDMLFAALVALYDAEHPEATCQTSTR